MLRAAQRLLLTGLCVVVAGCGGSSTVAGSSEQTSGGERDVQAGVAGLRNATLRSADFPRDWSKTVVPPPRARCADDDPRASAAASSSSRLFEQGDTAVQQVVWVFRDARTATKAYALTQVRSARSCLRRMVEQQVLRRREGKLSSLDMVGSEEAADRRHVRLAAEAHTLVQTPLGEADAIVRVLTDIEVTRVGRSISLIVLMSTTRPFDDTIREHLLHLANRRLASFA